MAEHLLHITASDARVVPARICGLLAQRNIEVVSIQMVRPDVQARWCVQLQVRAPDSEALTLVVKRLNRLLDVVKVVEISPDSGHMRQSVHVRLRPAASDLIHVSEIVSLFGAEMLEVTPSGATAHLSAHPVRCKEFVAMLKPYAVVETVFGAVSGLGREAFRPEPHRLPGRGRDQSRPQLV